MNINLHIERLILDGLPFEARHRAALQTAIELELARLLTENGVASNWQSSGAVSSVRADAIQMTTKSDPTQIGRQIAGSIYGSIGKTI
jgi:hypothetical protein